MEHFMPKRVLHVVGAMNRAGTETMLMNIYRNIDREKVQFDFISYSQQDAHYDEEIKSLGGKVIKLENTQSIKELYKAIKQNGPYEVVHSHTLFHCGIANIAAIFAGCKVRISHAHTTLDQSDSLIKIVYIKLMRVIINSLSTKLLACSNEAGHYLFGTKGRTKKKYQYFPNLINYSTFMEQQSDKVEKFKVNEGLRDSIVIGHIGRFIESKNHHFLLEIMKSLREENINVNLLLVGDGDLRTEIENLANEYEIYQDIRFVGIRDDVATMLHSMDIFVFPSIYEGLGLVLLEAQATGLPCIVSEAIQPEADLQIGLVTKLELADGAEAWGKKIMELIKNRESDQQKIISGFEEKGYSLQAGISKLMEIYRI